MGPTSIRALSLDMGGTHIGCGLVEDERLLASTTVPSSGARGLKSLLGTIAQALHSLLEQAKLRPADCAGLAMGFPGIVDARTGKVRTTFKKYEDAVHLDLPQWSLKTFGIPLCIENDARMALLGEHHAGSAKGVDDAVMMTLGTGIGSAAMIRGRLLRGVHFQAGCLGGHLPINFHGRLCTCGNIGCAEAEAGGWALPELIRTWPGFSTSTLANGEPLNFERLFAQAEVGDLVATEVRQHCLDAWAANAVALVHAYDPEIVVIGGGVMKSSRAFLPAIQKHLDQHACTSWGKAQTRAATLGNDAALFGAIPLLLEDMNDKTI
ncbi:MAG: ROK family protein [Terracidiphilus sp.]